MNQKWLSDFLEYLKIERQYSEKTVENYQKDILDFFKFLEDTGTSNIEKVTVRDVRIYTSELYDRGYKRTTMQRHMSSLRSFYRFLLQQQVVAENPFEYVVMKRKEKRLPTFFYEKEMDALFEASLGDQPLDLRNTALLELLYATGMRVSECTNLKWSDIDLNQRFIKVIGKGSKERYVPFNHHAKQSLIDYLNNGRPFLVKNSQTHDFVFVNSKGDPLTSRGVRYILNKIIEKSSLNTSIHPHELRHTFATHLLSQGADMRTVQELLGHVDLSSTQIYAHVTKEKLQETYRHCHPRA